MGVEGKEIIENLFYDFFFTTRIRNRTTNYNENKLENNLVIILIFFTSSAYTISRIKYRRCLLWHLQQIFLQSLVPISQFNKGQAAKIFDRLHSEKELIVLKNNQPSAVILSPEEYTRLTEIEENYFLLLEANRRIEENGDKKTVSLDSVMDHLGISKEELLDAEDADIE